MSDNAAKLRELLSCWKVFSVYFDWCGMLYIQCHDFCLLLADLQAYLLCKGAKMEYLLLHVLMGVRVCETSARLSVKSRSSSIVVKIHLMPCGWSSLVRCITQSITMFKSSIDIEQPCLTPVLTSKLDLLFPTLHVKLL